MVTTKEMFCIMYGLDDQAKKQVAKNCKQLKKKRHWFEELGRDDEHKWCEGCDCLVHEDNFKEAKHYDELCVDCIEKGVDNEANETCEQD